jgi:hypothetical protein
MRHLLKKHLQDIIKRKAGGKKHQEGILAKKEGREKHQRGPLLAMLSVELLRGMSSAPPDRYSSRIQRLNS